MQPGWVFLGKGGKMKTFLFPIRLPRALKGASQVHCRKSLICNG